MLGLPRWANLRLRTKLALLIESSILIFGAAAGLVASVRIRAALENELKTRGLATATDLASASVRPLLAGDLAALRRLVTRATRQDHVGQVVVLANGGRVVMHSDLTKLGQRMPGERYDRAQAAPFAGVEEVPHQGTGAHQYDIYSPVTAADVRLGTVVIGYSRASAEAAFARMRRDLAWAWLLAASAGGVLSFLLSSYISRPVTRIADAMRRAPAGGAAPLAAHEGGDELGLLAASYNEMASELAAHRQHLTDLVHARTAELLDANAHLEQEVTERARIEEELLASRQELRALASHLEEVRELERADVAREIHDELGQALTVLKMDVHWLGQRPVSASAADERLRSMARSIDRTVQAVRRISSRLRPQLLDDLGLSAAIEWQAREFQRHTGIRCCIRSDPDDFVLDDARSTALFRIFQETLTNVARHAQGTRVDVTLTRAERSVEMTVSDDGRGLEDRARAGDRPTLGMVGMRERARALGGTLDITGPPGRGTTVHVTLPCPGRLP